MAVHQCLLLGLLFHGLPGIIAGDSSPAGLGVTVELKENHVFLHCSIATGNENVTWTKDGLPLELQGKVLDLGPALDDPRGSYWCATGQRTTEALQVFIRMCQSCVQVDVATLAGLLGASLGTTVLLALAVSKIAAQEPGRLSRASDKQILLANDQLYQPLGERSNGQYSQIGMAKPRRR